MNEKEAIFKIKQLLYKMKSCKSKKMKEFYLSDIVTLEQYLEINYNIVLEDTKILDDVSYDIDEVLEDYFFKSTNDFISLNDKTKTLANGCINIYDKTGYIMCNPKNFSKYSTKYLNESLKEFLLKIDDNMLNQFKKYVNQGVLVGNYEDSFDGVCFNLVDDNRQVMAINKSSYLNAPSVSEVGFFVTLIHEFGHAVHKNIINSTGINKNYANPFEESISILFEKMYLKYLEENGISITKELKNEYNLLLMNSILARAGSLAVKDNNLIDNYIIPEQYFTKKYFDKYTYLFNCLNCEEYLEPLIYFYGELIASKYLDEYKNDYKNATKDLLEILLKWENTSCIDLLNEIGLKSVPKGIVKDLRKVKY